MDKEGYQPNIVEGLLATLNIFLLLFINSIRSRLGALEKNKVTPEICQLKREKDKLAVDTITLSVGKIEAHVEEIFIQNHAINLSIAELNGKVEGEKNNGKRGR